MASDKKNNKDQNIVENLNSHLTSAGEKVANNKKIIYICVGVVAVVAAFVLSYLFIFRNPRLENSWSAYKQVFIQQQKQELANDSVIAQAYQKVADQYGSTDAGNMASLAASLAFYNTKNYDAAIKYLNKADFSEPALKTQAKTLLGDCYVNKKDYNKAISCYEEAIKIADGNPEQVPYILSKEANVYEEQKQYDKAIACYETIKNDYPDYNMGNGLGADYYIELLKAKTGK